MRPEAPRATLLGLGPLADLPRGIVPDVLRVPARELSDPLSLVVAMKSDDCLIHAPVRQAGT